MSTIEQALNLPLQEIKKTLISSSKALYKEKEYLLQNSHAEDGIARGCEILMALEYINLMLSLIEKKEKGELASEHSKFEVTDKFNETVKGMESAIRDYQKQMADLQQQVSTIRALILGKSKPVQIH